MPRRPTTRATGVLEGDAGSNVWWIRYRVNGVLKREKVDRRGDAIALYDRRKSKIEQKPNCPRIRRDWFLRSHSGERKIAEVLQYP
jgi:hypothetical protein